MFSEYKTKLLPCYIKIQVVEMMENGIVTQQTTHNEAQLFLMKKKMVKAMWNTIFQKSYYTSIIF